jgi:hypothetical protein
MIYVLTKVLGVDAIKTSVYNNREAAEQNMMKWVRMIAPENFELRGYERETGEIVYPVNLSSDPTEYTVFIIKPCEIKS